MFDRIKYYCDRMYKGYYVVDASYTELGLHLYSVELHTYSENPNIKLTFISDPEGRVTPVGFEEISKNIL